MNATDLDRMTRLLSGSRLFADFSCEVLKELAAVSVQRSFPEKTVIFEKGAPGNEMFALLRGRVKISTQSDDGKEIIFAILEGGDFFGEASLLDGHPRSATCTAIEPCEMVVIERRSFIPFLEHQPKIAIHLLALLSQRLRAVDELMEDINFFPLSVRLARKLLALAADHGNVVGTRTVVALPLSQHDLGNMISVSRESVNKQLNHWVKDGLISLNGGNFVIEDKRQLQKLARMG